MISFATKGVAPFNERNRCEMEKQILLLHRFAHRRNADASFDSICLGCFVTVGSAPVDAALKDLESVHHCEPWGVDAYRNISGSSVRSRLPRESITP